MFLCQALHYAKLLAAQDNRAQYVCEYAPGSYCIAIWTNDPTAIRVDPDITTLSYAAQFDPIDFIPD